MNNNILIAATIVILFVSFIVMALCLVIRFLRKVVWVPKTESFHQIDLFLKEFKEFCKKRNNQDLFEKGKQECYENLFTIIKASDVYTYKLMLIAIQEYRTRLAHLDRAFSENKKLQGNKVTKEDILDLIFGNNTYDVFIQTIESIDQVRQGVVVPFRKD